MRDAGVIWWHPRELWLQDPLTWTIYGMISSQLSDSTDMIALEDGQLVTVSTYVFDTYNYRHKVRVWLDSGASFLPAEPPSACLCLCKSLESTVGLWSTRRVAVICGPACDNFQPINLNMCVVQYEGYCVLILCAMIVVGHVITALCLAKLNFLKR